MDEKEKKYAKNKNRFWRKNLIHARLKQLRQEHDMSQRDLAHALQLMGIDIDKNVITRIETNQRYVTDIEIQAFARLFHISCDALICGVSEGKQQSI